MNEEHHTHKERHEHKTHHAHKHRKKQRLIAWKYTTAILTILLIISVFTSGFGLMSSKPKSIGTSKVLTKEEAGKKAVDYINNNLIQPGTAAKLESIKEESDLYSIKLTIGGNEYGSFVTKDGAMLFPSAIDLNEKQEPSQPSQAQPSGVTSSKDMEELVDDDAFKGDENAPVIIVEFSDFECPFCTRFYSDTLPQIKKEYIETGKVKFVYRDFPLSFHANAKKAAEAAECAGEQEKFWEMHDKLFDEGVKGGVSLFKQFAVDIGLDTKKFNECLDIGKMADEVENDLAAGSNVGISGTPGFIINGQLVSGAQPFEVFKQIIEEELAK